jgi:homoserine dehydrogenase
LRTINIGIIGIGTVGSGVVKVLKKGRRAFKLNQGVDLKIVACSARHKATAERVGLEDIYVKDPFKIVNDPNIDIVIELVGGTGVAKDILYAALKAGKAVVTANKAVIATYGEEVFSLVDEFGGSLSFEASVGGGIPIIDPLKTSLAANEISSVVGIMNGTTNYMLTKMSEEKLSYEDALAQAQKKGFAEADPSADVEGYDAAAKIAILASIAFNKRVTIDDVTTEGITEITPTDLEYAREMGYALKLLAIANNTPKGIDVRVGPTMINKEHPLASINGVYNAIYVVGDPVGETMFFGEGAGSGPTASAVVGDVIEIAKALGGERAAIAGCTCSSVAKIAPIECLKSRYYTRFPVYDKPGVFAKIAEKFAAEKVSIHSCVQKGTNDYGGADLVVVTHKAEEAAISRALKAIAKTGVTTAKPLIVRVHD